MTFLHSQEGAAVRAQAVLLTCVDTERHSEVNGTRPSKARRMSCPLLCRCFPWITRRSHHFRQHRGFGDTRHTRTSRDTLGPAESFCLDLGRDNKSVRLSATITADRMTASAIVLTVGILPCTTFPEIQNQIFSAGYTVQRWTPERTRAVASLPERERSISPSSRSRGGRLRVPWLCMSSKFQCWCSVTSLVQLRIPYSTDILSVWYLVACTMI